MGWFDEDDDDDDENHDKNKTASHVHDNDNDSTLVGLPNHDLTEDPLDAYMKTIGTALVAQTTTSTNAANRQNNHDDNDLTNEQDQGESDTEHWGSGGNNNNNNNMMKNISIRLDLDNEDEATSHWEQRNAIESGHHVVHAADHSDIRTQQIKDRIFVKGSFGQDNLDNISSPGMISRGGSSSAGQSSGIVFMREGEQQQHTPDTPSEWNTAFTKSFLPKQWPTDTNHGKQWRTDQQVRIHPMAGSAISNIVRSGHSLASSESTSSSLLLMDPIYHLEELREIFHPQLLRVIQTQGFVKPTVVQSQALPLALAGYDLLVTAATGQGKTLAYIWPLTRQVQWHKEQQQYRERTTDTIPASTAMIQGPWALVLVPTRELAQQVQRVAKPMLEAVGASSRAVIGGQGKYLLQQELKHQGGVDVVIATPGRLVDVIADYRKTGSNNRKGLGMAHVTYLVLDEADKMLHMGFEKQVRYILTQLRPDRQSLMFSATMSRRMEKVASEWLSRTALRLSVGRTGQAVDTVLQHVMVLPSVTAKTQFVSELLPDLVHVGRTLIFVATRERCESLASELRSATSLTIDTLHGDKHQSDRTAALRAFTRMEVPVLVATDVAARGLDVPQVATVLNYDPAKTLDAHVHRVGRAGRLSKDHDQQLGSAYTLLVQSHDADFAQILMSSLEREGREIPDELEVLAQKSRKAGNVVARNHHNKSGLGSDRRDVSQISSRNHDFPPASKRGRWE